MRQAELGVAANGHTLRATGITAFLLNGGSLKNTQANAAPHHQALRPHCLSKLTLETYLTPCTLLKSAPSVRTAGWRVVGFFRLGGVAPARPASEWEQVVPVRTRWRRAESETQGRGAVEAYSPSRHSKRAANRSTMSRPMFRQAVAAGEGALHTFSTRAASRISKSYTRLPWRLRA